MQLLKCKLYNLTDKSITFNEFDTSLDRINKLVINIKTFDTKEDAINFMMKETNLSFEECSKAYDFYINLYK